MIEILNNIIQNYKSDNDYIIKNYSLEQRIEIINKLVEIKETDSIYSRLREFVDSNDDYLKFFKPEEALNLLLQKENINIDSFFETFLLTNLNDEGRKIILDKYINDLDRYNTNEIIRSFENSKLMIDWLKENRELYDITDLNLFLRNLDDDDLVYAIEKLDKELEKINLKSYFISEIKNLDKRAKLYISSNLFSKALDIIGQITNESLIIEILSCISEIVSEEKAQKFIIGLDKITNEDKQMELLLELSNKYGFSMIAILQNMDDKKAFSTILKLKEKDYDLAMNLVPYLNSDESKLYIINLEKDKIDKLDLIDIIYTLNDDKLKIKYLKENECTRRDVCHIIISLSDDRMKKDLLLEYLDVLSEPEFFSIVNGIESDEVKLEIINDPKFGLRTFHKSRIIEYITDPELRLSLTVSEALKNRNYGWLEEKILHDDELIKCKTINYALLKYYAERREISLENLCFFAENFGYIVLRFIDNKNIKKILNSDKETLNKFLLLFDKEKSLKLDESIIDSIYESIVQRIFRNTNPNNIFNLFQELHYHVLTNDKDKLQIKLTEIKNSGLIDFDRFDITIEDLIHNLFEPGKKLDSLSLLKQITDEYLIKTRNEYSKIRKRNLHKELNLNIVYEKKYLISRFLDQNSIEDIIKIIDKIDLNLLDNECKNLLSNKEILIECIKFKKSPNDYSGNFIKIKDYLKIINNIFDVIYEKEYYMLVSNCYYLEDKERKNCILDLKTNDSENILKIMSELDINQLKAVLFNNEGLYNELLNVLNKYKILGWNNIFGNALDEAGMEYDSSNAACLVSYFYKFYPDLIKKLEKGEIKVISLLSLLDEVSIFSSSSNLYSLLLKEDYSYIAKNPGPNSANLSKDQRLIRIPEKIKTMYSRKYITIPPIEENIQLDNDKSLNVTIGDVTNTINLTYGERTGACMRIGGAGSTLFDFCLGNENGFHVRITNPTTGKLVSRVSGFRNGNTIFLNQLRDSLDNNYKNEDLIKVIEEISKMLIDKTKDSKYPIDNVIISSGYAMSTRINDKITFSENIKEGYEYFYTDVSNGNAILLASSNEDNSLVELKLNPQNCEKYEVLRGKINCISDRIQIVKNVTRLHIIKELLEGKDISDIVIAQNPMASYASKLYIGDDWYIAVDDSNNILDEFYIDRGLSKIHEEINYVKNSFITNYVESKEGVFGL